MWNIIFIILKKTMGFVRNSFLKVKKNLVCMHGCFMKQFVFCLIMHMIYLKSGFNTVYFHY